MNINDITYDDLNTYSEVLNQVKDLTADIQENMSGAFPDNGKSPYFQAALRQAELLVANAEALRNEIRSFRLEEANMQAAEATCSCSNPFCQV